MMKGIARYAGVLSAAIAGLAASWYALTASTTRLDDGGRSPTASKVDGGAPSSASPVAAGPRVPAFSAGFIEDSGYDLAVRYTPAIPDRASLPDVAAAYRARPSKGRADLRAKLEALEKAAPRPEDYDRRRAMLQVFAGLLESYEGRFDEATAWFERAIVENPGLKDPDMRANLAVLRGVAAMRRGELENCVECLGPSSCIFPIDPRARHRKPDGSRTAMARFQEYLRERPEDFGVRWLLNVAAMTVGEYPKGVPPEFLVPAEPRGAGSGLGRFPNVASESGLTVRGPHMLGGSLFDDFDGDDRPDLLVSSGDWDFGAALFINKGDGTFEDRGEAAGLEPQTLAVNAQHADFDNDGRLDVLLLRGGWESPIRLSLLRNLGGRFEDVTTAAGLGEPIASQAAAWGDYDNDGRLDLYVAGEYREGQSDTRNWCRLYHNNGDGTFADVAAAAGVDNSRWAKGCAWGDYDDDGRIDLYVSNMNGENRLYRNNGDGTFVDVAPELGLTGPKRSFSCWFWDFDDDGRLDIFVTGFGATLNDIIADRLGKPAEGDRPALYRNLGEGRFRDVTAEAGLDRVWLPMGSNFADVDNDGHLDFYLATGRPPYSILVPNVLMRNVDGRRFEDVTEVTGTGHLQKGHGVSFADLDDDGDLDLFVQAGGQTPGDRAFNVLFRNPGHGHHHLRLKLIGTRSNRAAIGARVKIDLVDPDGHHRSIHRVIGEGSSFGGNTLSPPIGLGDAASVESVTVAWPGGARQTFQGLALDQAFEVTEGTDSPRALPRPAPR